MTRNAERRANDGNGEPRRADDGNGEPRRSDDEVAARRHLEEDSESPGTTPNDRLETGSRSLHEPVDGNPGVLRSTGGRLRDDPLCWLPFAVAGIVLLAADRLRASDSLPTAPGPSETTITVPYTIYPSGPTTTARPLESLVDLHTPMLAYGLGLEAVALVAVAGAGWLTMTRAAGLPYRLERFGAYAGLVLGIDLLFRAAGAAGLEYAGGSLLVALALLALVAFVAVRLFLVPVAVVTGTGLVRSIPASWRRSRGHSWTILGLILLFGIGSQLLVRVPYIGTAIAVTVVGTVHAVSLVVLTGDA